MKRVVITGTGTINALGHSVADTMTAMAEGRCGIGPLAFRDLERLSIHIGGQVRGFEAEGRYNRQQMSLYDRFTQFTLAAAAEAIAQSGITFSGELAAKSGVVLVNEGIYIAPSAFETWFITDALTYQDLDETIAAVAKVAQTL